MKQSLLHLLALWLCWCPLNAFAALENGVYSISCLQGDGYVALGAKHNVDPYICYIKDGSDLTADAYWVVTNTKSGYTFRNEATGQYLVFTTDRVDANYKYMTLADSAPDDQSHLWYVSENDDGSFSINSVISDSYYWNLRYDQGLLGTYHGGWGNSNNEHFFFEKKGDDSGPDPQIDPNPADRSSFPDALHVYLKDGRLEAYPKVYVTKYSQTDEQLVIETNIGQTFTYALADVNSVSETAPTDFPTFESFKFNNKHNDQVFTDANGEIIGDTVFVTIAAIGKRLTPSFKLPEGENVEVYVNNELQESKVSRLRFDKDIYYVITRPGYRILLPVESSEKGASTYSMQPYGRMVRVHVDWLTDRAEVPTIYINTSDGRPIESKDYFKNATIRIDGHDIFPSMDETEVQIKGRGNSSWGWPKKPYRLKFANAVKPLGMKKGKNWVLLSNYQTGSMMSNAIGMKAANLMGAAAANHIVPVDIYLNGEFQGSYNLTEKVGLASNSVDLDDESAAALLELDSYYDETNGQKFRSEPYDLPINVKEPDFSEGTTSLTLEDISSNFNAFMRTVYWKRDISKYVDVTQLARFLMVNELILNYEFYHPKSTFCYRESFESDTSKYVFGPVWDLDWAYGYERYGNYFRNEATNNYWIDCPGMEVVGFIRDLRFKYEPLSVIYKELWEQFMENDLTELQEYCQDYYDFAKNSFKDNRKVWGDYTDYAAQAQEASDWLAIRSQTIYDDIVSGRMPDIIDPGEDPGDEPEEKLFANNKLYTLKCRRGGLVLNDYHTGLAAGQTRRDAPEEDKLFAILYIEGKNYLYSPVTEEFLNYKYDGNWVDALGTPIHFSTDHADGKYLYMLSVKNESGGTYYFNNNGQIVINSWDIPDDGNRWLIEEAGDFDPTEALALAEESFFAVTNRILFNGQVVGEETVKVADGSMPPMPSKKWENLYTHLIEPEDIPFAVHEDLTVDYEADWTGPFRFSTSEKDAVWYNMHIRSGWYVGKEDSEPYYPKEDDGIVTQTAEYLWAFGGDPYHVKVYNYTTGFAETLTKDGENAVMRKGDYTWDLLPNNGGFVLRETGTDYCCINQFGGGGGPLKFWDDGNSTTDDGSTFRVEEVQPVDEKILANSISLDKTSLTFTEKNQTATLTATVLPSNATDKSVTWTSNKISVATVDANGKVTAVANGSATITAKTNDGSKLTATCIVTVDIPIIATSISLDKTSLTFTEKNQTATLTATVLPSNAPNKSVTWTSNKNSVATVDANGKVTAVANGTATITAKTNDGSKLTATCIVTVDIPIIATSISLDKTSLTFTEKNQTATLTATVLPSNAPNKSVTWTSNKNSVATVDANGKVTAVANGSATITAKTNDGSKLTATCIVTVDIPEPIFSNNKLYTLTCKRGGLVMNAEGTGLAAGQTRTDAPETDKRFAIITYNGQYYLYSPTVKQYLIADGSFVSRLGSPISFDDSKADGVYKYMLSTQGTNGETWYFNNNGDIVINSWDAADDGNRWLIEPVADFDPTEALAMATARTFMVTYEVLYEGKVVATATEEVASGSALPAPPASLKNDYITLTKSGTHPTKVTKDVTVKFTVKWNGPFEFSKNVTNAKWYNMHINYGWYVGKEDSEPYYPKTDDGMLTQTAEYLWAFGGDPYHVKVYNYTTGFAETLTKDGENAVMREGEYAWDLLSNNGGFVLRETGTDYCCINQYGGAGGPLKFWDNRNSPTENASTFRVEEAMDIVDGISSIDNSQFIIHNEEVYDLSGRKMSNGRRKGIYIVRMKDGTSRKVLIK